MSHCFVRHPVADFDAWKAVYDAHRADRESAGMKEVQVWRNEDDPNDVCILFEVGDRDAAMAFSSSDALKVAMQEAGVAGEVTTLWLR